MQLYNFKVGLDQPFFLIAGPCVIESEQLALETAFKLKEITSKLKINFIYKTSFTKANRTSVHGYRGVALDEGLRILKRIKDEIKVLVLTDVHDDTPIEEVVKVVDVLQIPAFLCRQTNFIKRVVNCGKPVNIKKGQFLAPYDMKNVAEKAKSFGNNKIMVCERGVSFGYNNLVVDMRSLAIMRDTDCPVIFDAGHAVQLPGGGGHFTEGQREFIPVLARAAIAAGISGLFIETHPHPDQALCDGPNSFPLARIEELLIELKEIDAVVKKHKFLENELKTSS